MISPLDHFEIINLGRLIYLLPVEGCFAKPIIQRDLILPALMHSANVASPYFVAVELVHHLPWRDLIAEIADRVSYRSDKRSERSEALIMRIGDNRSRDFRLRRALHG